MSFASAEAHIHIRGASDANGNLLLVNPTVQDDIVIIIEVVETSRPSASKFWQGREFKAKVSYHTLMPFKCLFKCLIVNISIIWCFHINLQSCYFVYVIPSLQPATTSFTMKDTRDKIEVDYKQKIDGLISEIERTAPNLKALDQYEALLEKERVVTEEYEAVRKEEREKANRFEEVKQTRFKLFMDAFNHIAGNIDKIYKQLTKSSTHPLGGTAYLNLENDDDPYLHGIKYTAMPPTKRFRDMEQLSGGEKTVAALALLFSIHSYKPSPFFILDEVDAALDNLNVSKVAGFIRSKSCDGARTSQDAEGGCGFQSIVISLKDSFYDKAEALIGVCRDSDRGCSRILTFDLTKYPEA